MFFPDIMPEINITEVDEPPFEVEFRQVLGSFHGLEVGNECLAAEYDTRKDTVKRKSGENKSVVRRKAKVHGIDCVEVVSSYVGFVDENTYQCTTFERITDSHIQTLAAMEDSYGVLLVQTFLDDDFKKHWTVGKDNCGLEIRLRRKGIINSCNNDLFSDIIDPGTYDIVGRYQVSTGNRTFDTVRLVLIACDGQVTDFFIDREGKEILHRFWVLDSWGYDDDIKLPYSVRWPHVEVICLNGEKRVCTTYVIPEYVL